ncbi:hypothetical protein HGRIS_003674 [Hohenbuehelia grisea]|uniref:Nicotinate phosphoribosyltransferase n=1 Tax=Hohenbuehelia grisea TaxID=104357 RepID=A0ABR3JG86_9AGAR
MAAPYTSLAVPPSILDTDLYKVLALTMQQAVLHHFPRAQATYKFTNRDKSTLFSRQCADRFRAAVSQFTDLRLTQAEHQWLAGACPYLTPAYLAYLSKYRFKPEQVRITFLPQTADGIFGTIEMDISGPWVETILWEVPLMACLSESFFSVDRTDWTMDGQADRAYDKGRRLLEAGCVFSDFGTRRRRSFRAQDILVQNLVRARNDSPNASGKLTGTSNLHLARKYGINPVGTQAHEWFMGVAALRGYEEANSLALALWEEVFPNDLLVALTDTFSSQAFFKGFGSDVDRARRWTGLRQDSGDPFEFAPRAQEVYQALGINYSEKQIVYSDSLDVDKAINLRKHCEDIGFKPTFGIGTFLTNDFRTASTGEKSKALNMVIKLSSVDTNPCVKISDDLTKNTGDPATVAYVKKLFGLPCV